MDPVTKIHQFRPGESGTQCIVTGCWGWVDDVRHAFHPLGATQPPMERMRRQGTRKPLAETHRRGLIRG
jgi:hypothetical protein